MTGVPAERGAHILRLPARWPWPQPELALGCTLFFSIPLVVFAIDMISDPSRFGRLPVNVRLGLGACVIAAGVAKWIHARMRRAAWHAEVFEKGIDLKSSPTAPTRVWAPWEDVAWFDDSEQENVRVKLEGPVSGLIDIYLATRSESDRTALLGILAAKAKRRAE
jgi:hypothetical protein